MPQPEFDPKQFVEGESEVGVITSSMISQAKTGTAQLSVAVKTVRGTAYGDLAITERTVENLKKSFRDLGLSPEQYATDEFTESVGTFLNGRACSVVMEVNDFEGNKSWRIRFLNGPIGGVRRTSATNAAKAHVRSLLGGSGRPSQAGPPPAFENGVTDADVPF